SKAGIARRAMASLGVTAPFDESRRHVLHYGLKVAGTSAATQEGAKHYLRHLRIVRVWCKAPPVALPPELITPHAAWRKSPANLLSAQEFSPMSHRIADGSAKNRSLHTVQDCRLSHAGIRPIHAPGSVLLQWCVSTSPQ